MHFFLALRARRKKQFFRGSILFQLCVPESLSRLGVLRKFNAIKKALKIIISKKLRFNFCVLAEFLQLEQIIDIYFSLDTTNIFFLKLFFQKRDTNLKEKLTNLASIGAKIILHFKSRSTH